MRQIPGVSGAGLAMYNPLTDNWGELIVVKGHPVKKLSEDAGSSWDRVTADYLQNFNVSLVRGRYFTPQDTQNSGNVAIINQAFVKRFFRNDEDPIGQYFGIDLPENSGSYRIVGIVRDAKFAGFNLNQPARPMFYVPLDQTTAYADTMLQSLELQSHRMYGLSLVTHLSPGALEPQIVRTLANIDPNLTINSVRTMEEQVALSFDQDRAVASLAALFGLVALLLAAVGLYGVTAYTVAQRTNEIGIRMALGADRSGVVGYVLRDAFTRVVIGLALGIPLAILAGKLIATQLYGVAFFDPPALGLATVSLAFVAFIAAMIPAASAASISPLLALRGE
jgi:predicted permease